MKFIPMIAAASLAIAPMAANAGGLAAAVQEPMMDMDTMAPAGGSIDSSLLLPLMLLTLLAVASSADEGEGED